MPLNYKYIRLQLWKNMSPLVLNTTDGHLKCPWYDTVALFTAVLREQGDPHQIFSIHTCSILFVCFWSEITRGRGDGSSAQLGNDLVKIRDLVVSLQRTVRDRPFRLCQQPCDEPLLIRERWRCDILSPALQSAATVRKPAFSFASARFGFTANVANFAQESRWRAGSRGRSPALRGALGARRGAPRPRSRRRWGKGRAGQSPPQPRAARRRRPSPSPQVAGQPRGWGGGGPASPCRARSCRSPRGPGCPRLLGGAVAPRGWEPAPPPPALTSVSLFRFHRSRRPIPSTQAKSAGCTGDHMTS